MIKKIDQYTVEEFKTTLRVMEVMNEDMSFHEISELENCIRFIIKQMEIKNE